LFIICCSLGLLIVLYAQTHAERFDTRSFVFLLSDWLNQLCQLAITNSTQTAQWLNVGIFGEKPVSRHITAYLSCLLQTLQSMMNLGHFYDCLPLILIPWLSSPVSNAHCLQIFFNWIQPSDSRPAYLSSTLWFM
jgi:hypothetical protein